MWWKDHPGIQPGQPPQLAQPTVNNDGKEVYVNIKDFNAPGLGNFLALLYWFGTGPVKPKTAIIQNSKCTCFSLAAIL